MTLEEIRKLPTSIGRQHESLLRSYNIISKVVELLDQGTPTPVILEIIQDLRSAPHHPLAMDMP